MEEKTKLYKAIGYKDEHSNQRISYPTEVYNTYKISIKYIYL
jgi:hypothetical protein